MMPGIDGFETLKKLRLENNIPVIMLTARNEEYDRLLGFDMGVDDYLAKPFSPKELMARVKAVLKRYNGYAYDKLEFGDLKIFPEKKLLHQVIRITI